MRSCVCVCVLKFSQKTVNHYRFYRYVVFMLQRFIAECQLGYYGKDCQGVCSVNCFHASRCYKFTGQCYVGCKPGWTGNKCDQRKSMVFIFLCSKGLLKYLWTSYRILQWNMQDLNRFLLLVVFHETCIKHFRKKQFLIFIIFSATSFEV